MEATYKIIHLTPEACRELQLPEGSVEINDPEMLARFNRFEDAQSAISDVRAREKQIPKYQQVGKVILANPEWRNARWTLRAFTHPEQKKCWFAVTEKEPEQLIITA